MHIDVSKFIVLLVSKKTFDIVLCDKPWECFQHLRVTLHLQQVVKAMCNTLCAKVQIIDDTYMWSSHVQHWFSPTLFGIYIDELETYFNEIDMDFSPYLFTALVVILLCVDDVILLSN